MIFIALDLGSKRIGVAKTDPLGMMAHAHAMILRKSDQQVMDEVRGLVEESGAERVVIGLPKLMNGDLGPAAQQAMVFGAKLQEQIPEVRIEYWDERLSTKGTEQNLRELELTRARKKKVVDKLAAQWILQGYLDAHQNGMA